MGSLACCAAVGNGGAGRYQPVRRFPIYPT